MPPLTPDDKRGIEDSSKPVMPLRFLEIEGLEKNFPDNFIELHAVISATFSRKGKIVFEGTEDIAFQLNRLVELGTHTMEATSFMGVFVDGDRERLPYEADGYINQLGWLAITGDHTVPHNTIEALLEKPTWPSEWMSQLIFMVWTNYRVTADKEYLGSIIDKLRVFSLIDFIDETGLVTTVNNKELSEKFVKTTGADYLEDIVDWPQVERDGYEMQPYNTVVNAFVYEALRLMALMSTELERKDDADLYSVAAEKLRIKIQTLLIDPETHLYIDGIGSKHNAAHASFVPLAFGLVPEQSINATLKHLESRIQANSGGFPCSVYGAQYLLEGLFLSGQPEMATRLMLNTSVRGWRNMLDVHDATITHEAWDPVFKPNIDWTHAWGAAFLNIMYRFMVGAKPLSPRWDRWTLTPVDVFNLSIRSSIPTPHGIVEVSIDASSRVITIRSPETAVFIEPEATVLQPWKIIQSTYSA
jgi:hypothetical protein